jgi:hypothetical protein
MTLNSTQLRLRLDSDRISEFKIELIDAGFDILPILKWQKEPYSYFGCHKDGRFLYVQKASLQEGWSVSSLYIPSREHGSGRLLIESTPLTVSTMELALTVPQSFNSERYPRSTDVKFYKNLAHYLELEKESFATT